MEFVPSGGEMTFQEPYVIYLPFQNGRKSLFLYFDCLYILGKNPSCNELLEDVLAAQLSVIQL